VHEYLRGGDLTALRRNAHEAGIALTEEYFMPIFKQCLVGLFHLHAHAILHCDIKEPNIMIRNACHRHPHIVLVDFGLARSSVGRGISGGTLGYKPPETCSNNVWWPKGDVFSMGVVFFQLMADMVPSGSHKFGVFQCADIDKPNCPATREEIKRKIIQERDLPIGKIEKDFPGVKDWLMPMVHKDRAERPVPLTTLRGPWFARDTDTFSETDPWFTCELPQCTAACSMRLRKEDALETICNSCFCFA
jgi:serine/threonine protein kinase